MSKPHLPRRNESYHSDAPTIVPQIPGQHRSTPHRGNSFVQKTRREFLLDQLSRRSQDAVQQLIEHAGPFFGSVSEAATKTGMNSEDIARQIEAGHLVAIHSPADQQRLIPVWQFSGDAPLDGLSEVLEALDAGSTVAALLFLKTPATRFDDLTPTELLIEGRLDDALLLARSYREQGAR